MWPDRVSKPGPLTNESDFLPTALRGPDPLIVDPMSAGSTNNNFRDSPFAFFVQKGINS